MRRAFVPIAVLLSSFLFAVPALAPAVPAASARPEPRTIEEEEDVLFSLRADGYAVRVFGEDNDGEQTASMSIGRDGLSTIYLVPAKITDHSIEARFGGLGRLDFEFRTTPGTHDCRGLLTFNGSFTFNGEGGYVHVDADRARGILVERSYTECPPPGHEPRITEVATGVHLEATAGTRFADGSQSIHVAEYRGIRTQRREVRIDAFGIEERGSMKIAHGASVTASTAAFHRNLDAGTATLTPPAPFTGSATLRPGPDGEPAWEGTLAVPVLGGGEPIPLTGPEFDASLTRDEPIDP